jgi:hypothetical protein
LWYKGNRRLLIPFIIWWLAMGFPGCLDRCEHGEYYDRQCIYCELKKLKLENEELRQELKMLEERISTLEMRDI